MTRTLTMGSRAVSAAILCLGLLVCGSGVWAQSAGEKDQPRTRPSHSVRAEVFKEVEKAQAAIEKKQYGEAEGVLKKLTADAKLSDYERATVWSILATVHYERDDYAGAITAFRKVLEQQDIPPGMRVMTLFSLAQLQLASEQYRPCLETLKQYHAAVETPNADAYAVEGHAHYQLGNHRAAVEPLLNALRIARDQGIQFKESWLGLLRAAYYELGDHKNAAKVLEMLVVLYPKKEYWVQLAGIYGLLGRERDQLAALEAAWSAGMLDREAEIVNLAQLLMLQGVPFKAWRVLDKGMKEKGVRETFENLRLLAQAMAMAQESERQIPVLEKAAGLAKDGEIDLYLGQAYMDQTQWKKAAESLEAAVRKGVKRPGPAYLLLGTARMNQGSLEQARSAFARARNHAGSADQAAKWLQYVEAEETRRGYLAAAAEGG